VEGSLIGRGRTGSPPHVTATTEVRARCATAKWAIGIVGFFGYLFPAALVGLALGRLVDATGVPTTMLTRAVVLLAPLAVVVWRGARVTAAVRPDGLYIRNRWRSTLVPFGDIERIEAGTSIAYSLVGLVVSIRLIGSGYFAPQPEFLGNADMLLVTCRGRRLPRSVSATLGMAMHLEAMEPFLDALAAAGHPVQLESSDTESADN
jgi:hypothetical protein